MNLQLKHQIYAPPCLSEIVVKFAHSRSQNSLRFPATQKRIVTECQYTFSQQSAGRHNTLDFATQNRVPKVGFAPFGNPLFSRNRIAHQTASLVSQALRFLQNYKTKSGMSALLLRQYTVLFCKERGR